MATVLWHVTRSLDRIHLKPIGVSRAGQVTNLRVAVLA